jgi:hypothetical protein
MVFGVVPRLQAQVCSLPFVSGNPRVRGLLEHPAGPFTIHFWAPTAKWLISAANIADINRPVEKMSVPQQSAVAVTGVIWARYSTQVIPINYNLMLVNAVMACTGIFHLCVEPRSAHLPSFISLSLTLASSSPPTLFVFFSQLSYPDARNKQAQAAVARDNLANLLLGGAPGGGQYGLCPSAVVVSS